MEETKSECDDTSYMNCNEHICDKDDNSETSWIRSNDELCSLLLSKESNPKTFDSLEDKDLDSIEIEKVILHTNDDTYDEFKILAQEMAINPNIDNIFEINQMLAAGSKSSASSQSISPVKNFTNNYQSLQSTEGFYPVVASLKEDVIETEFVVIMEKLLLSLAVEESQKLANELISIAFLI